MKKIIANLKKMSGWQLLSAVFVVVAVVATAGWRIGGNSNPSRSLLTPLAEMQLQEAETADLVDKDHDLKPECDKTADDNNCETKTADRDFDNDRKVDPLDTDDDNDGTSDSLDTDDDNDGTDDSEDDDSNGDEDNDSIENQDDSDDDNDGVKDESEDSGDSAED